MLYTFALWLHFWNGALGVGVSQRRPNEFIELSNYEVVERVGCEIPTHGRIAHAGQ